MTKAPYLFPCFCPSITFVFILSFSYLPVCPVGSDLGSPGHGPRGSAARIHRERRGVFGLGVRTGLRRVIKGMECVSVRGESCILCDSKKKENSKIQYCTLMEPPSDLG